MKNTIADLNNHLFAELERLGDEDLTGEQIEREVERAKGINQIATTLINSYNVVLHAKKLQFEYNSSEEVLSIGEKK